MTCINLFLIFSKLRVGRRGGRVWFVTRNPLHTPCNWNQCKYDTNFKTQTMKDLQTLRTRVRCGCRMQADYCLKSQGRLTQQKSTCTLHGHGTYTRVFTKCPVKYVLASPPTQDRTNCICLWFSPHLHMLLYPCLKQSSNSFSMSFVIVKLKLDK